VTIFLFILFAAALCVDVFNIGMVSFFIYRKFSFVNFLKTLIVPVIIIFLGIVAGLLAGNWGMNLVPAMTKWLSASFFFVLGAKMVLDAFRFAHLKRQVNPTHLTGLISLSVFIALNALLGAIGFGFLGMVFANIWYVLPVFLLFFISSVVTGLKVKRLYKLYSEWILAAVSLFCAVLILYN
jgi:putative Mn2+ efflux pump MntP